MISRPRYLNKCKINSSKCWERYTIAMIIIKLQNLIIFFECVYWQNETHFRTEPCAHSIFKEAIGTDICSFFFLFFCSPLLRQMLQFSDRALSVRRNWKYVYGRISCLFIGCRRYWLLRTYCMYDTAPSLYMVSIFFFFSAFWTNK